MRLLWGALFILGGEVMKEKEIMPEEDDNWGMIGRIFSGFLLILGLIIVNFGGNVFYHHFFDQETTVQIVCECDCACCESQSE